MAKFPEPPEITMSASDIQKALQNVNEAMLVKFFGDEQRPKTFIMGVGMSEGLSLKQVADEIKKQSDIGKILAQVWRKRLW